MHKSSASLPQRLSAQQLERIAAKLTMSSHTLQMQILALHHELAVTRHELARSRQDLDESIVRLREIDEYALEMQSEIIAASAVAATHTANTTANSLTRDELQSREDQLDELLDERDEEVALLEHVRVIIELRETSQQKLRIVIAKLVKELCAVKRKEQLLVMLALRSRLVTLVVPKS